MVLLRNKNLIGHKKVMEVKKKSNAKEKRAAIVDCFIRVIVGKKRQEFYEKNKDSGREL